MNTGVVDRGGDELNNRHRMVLQNRCPADLFTALLALPRPSVLRR